MKKKVLMVAGEASGDLHGAALAGELLRLCPGLALEGMGGERMRKAGVFLRCAAEQVSVVGFSEVVGRLKALVQAFLVLRRILLEERPDLCVLIDYPDFNLLLARMAKRAGVPVVYFISPQVWAWRKGRVKLIRKLVGKMLLILPFEETLYREAGVDAVFVGHPLLDRLADIPSRGEARRKLGLGETGRVVGLLPGSRREELKRHLPMMFEAAKRIRPLLPDIRFVVALAEAFAQEEVETFLREDVPVEVVRGKTYEAMRASDLLIVASGTATLEAALLETPMVIIYRLSFLSALLGWFLIRVPHIGLVNLVAGKGVVPELLQYQATPGRIASVAFELLTTPERLEGIRRGLKEVREKLGPPGAVGRAAREILKMLEVRC